VYPAEACLYPLQADGERAAKAKLDGARLEKEELFRGPTDLAIPKITKHL